MVRKGYFVGFKDMLKEVLKIASAGSLFVLTLAAPSLAQVDACDDFLMRHNRRDITPSAISFGSATLNGELKQRVTITAKHVGEVAFVGKKPIAIVVDGKLAHTSTPDRIDPGQSVVFQLYFDKGTFPIIGSYKVSIDVNRTAGQWGCAVFSNDTKTLSNGVIIKPFPLPRPPLIPLEGLNP